MASLLLLQILLSSLMYSCQFVLLCMLIVLVSIFVLFVSSVCLNDITFA